MKETVRQLFDDSIEAMRRSLGLADAVADSAAILIETLRRGNKILVCGNGGSAADAQHFAAEMVGRFERERPGLPCIALTTDTSLLTAWSNDYSFEGVFARQVATLGSPGDVLIGITTSGNSPNVLRALEEAGARGMKRLALAGKGGGKLAQIEGVVSIIVPSDDTARIQEVHIMVIHAWSRLIEDACR